MPFDVAAPHGGSTLRASLRSVQNASGPRHFCVLNADGEIIDERTITNGSWVMDLLKSKSNEGERFIQRRATGHFEFELPFRRCHS